MRANIVVKKVGAISWTELMTTDPVHSADFYHQLFGWTVETMPMPQGPYRVLKVEGTPIGGIMGMLPGVQKAKKQIEAANINEKTIKRQEAIITSMTKAERKKIERQVGFLRQRLRALCLPP